MYLAKMKIKTKYKTSLFSVTPKLSKLGVTVKKNGNQIKHPTEYCTGNDPEDTDYGEDNVVLVNALYDTVDRPNDIKHRNAENELDYHRKIVDCLNEIFHSCSPFCLFDNSISYSCQKSNNSLTIF